MLPWIVICIGHLWSHLVSVRLIAVWRNAPGALRRNPRLASELGCLLFTCVVGARAERNKHKGIARFYCSVLSFILLLFGQLFFFLYSISCTFSCLIVFCLIYTLVYATEWEGSLSMLIWIITPIVIIIIFLMFSRLSWRLFFAFSWKNIYDPFRSLHLSDHRTGSGNYSTPALKCYGDCYLMVFTEWVNYTGASFNRKNCFSHQESLFIFYHSEMSENVLGGSAVLPHGRESPEALTAAWWVKYTHII